MRTAIDMGVGKVVRAFAVSMGLCGPALVLAAGAALAGSADAPTPAALADLTLADQTWQQGDFSHCRELLQRHVQAALVEADPRTKFFVVLKHCELNDPARPPSVGRVLDFLDPWLRRCDTDEIRAVRPWAFGQLLYARWVDLSYAGFNQESRDLAQRDIQGLMGRLSGPRADPHARVDLETIARRLYGNFDFIDLARSLLVLAEQGLPKGDAVIIHVLRAIAFDERKLARFAESLALSDRAAALAAEFHPGDRELEVTVASERAGALASNDRLADAMAEIEKWRDWSLQRQPPDHADLTRVHYNLAALAGAVGDWSASIRYADQSIAHAEMLPDSLAGRGVRAEALTAAASKHLARLHLGEASAAVDLRQVLDRAGIGEPAVFDSAYFLAEYTSKLGRADDESAAAYDFLARQVRFWANPLAASRSLLPLLEAWGRAGWPLEDPAVRAPLIRAFALTLTDRDRSLSSIVQFAFARHLRDRQPDEALWLYKRAANDLQRQREGLPDGDADMSRAWLSSYEDDLRDFIGLLIDRARLVEAEQAIRLLRGEELEDFTRRARGPRSAASSPLSYAPAEQVRNAELKPLAAALSRAAESAHARVTAQLGLSNRTNWQDPDADAAWDAASVALATLMAPRADLAALDVSPDALPALASPPAGTAHVAYFIRPSRLDIVLHSARGHRRVSVPIESVELNRLVQSFRAVLSSSQRDARPAGQALWRVLIAPIEADLRQARVTRLHLAPDGGLRYVSFAALHDGARYLAERFVSSLDFGVGPGAAALTQPAFKAPPAAGLAAFGRTLPDADHAGLPAVAREIDALRAIGARTAVDQAFTRERLAQELARRPAIVHLASHFMLDPAGEEQSYLLLGDGRHLSLSELRQLPWQGVQLAMLSACDSAVVIDSHAGPGREMVGFANALQRAGVSHVMATLWRIDDEVTADWMSRFYAPMRGPRALAAKAPDATLLSAAQRAWLAGHRGQDLAHPHYWAAFAWLEDATS